MSRRCCKFADKKNREQKFRGSSFSYTWRLERIALSAAIPIGWCFFPSVCNRSTPCFRLYVPQFLRPSAQTDDATLGCLSSCWSLRLGFSVSLYIRLSPPGSWIKLCVRPSVCGMRAWTCSATAKVKVNERVDAEDEGTLKTEPTRPRQLDKLLTWLVAYYRTLSDITYPNQSYTVGIHYYSTIWRSA